MEEVEQLKALKEKQSHGLTTLEAIKNLSRSDVRTPFLLVLSNFYLVLWTGPLVFIFYSVEIFQDAGINVNEYVAAILTAILRVFGGICSVFLVQRMPRVRLAMMMMTMMSLTLFVLGLVFYLKQNNVKSEILNGLPVACLCLYQFCFGGGILHNSCCNLCKMLIFRNGTLTMGISW